MDPNELELMTDCTCYFSSCNISLVRAISYGNVLVRGVNPICWLLQKRSEEVVLVLVLFISLFVSSHKP